jgi:ubiquinone/menaquinone biosynthesis C-methylase UbiE
MPDDDPQEAMRRLLQGAWVTQALHATAALGIADRLGEGSATSGQLAAATGAHADSLHRLLRYLAGLGIVDGDGSGGFRLTALGALLRSGVPGSMRDRALSYGGYGYRAFGELLHTIRTGEPAFDHLYGMPAYDYLARRPELARSFDRQMQSGAPFFARVPEVYDFPATATVVDVAGGNGTLLAAVLSATPAARGVLFDVPHVVEAARDRLREEGLLDRCELVGGDFLTSVPSGGDVYVLSRILHNWDDERCQALLTACRRAMDPGAVLLVIELLVPEDGSPAIAVARDMNMMTVFGGRERTWTEFRTLLGSAGFELEDRRALPSGFVLLCARRR